MRRRKNDPDQQMRELEARLVAVQAELERVKQQAAMRRPARRVHKGKLTERQIEEFIRTRAIGTYSDTGNLSLQIYPRGRDGGVIVSWLFRWTTTISVGNYKSESMGLGAYRDMSLDEAREEAFKYRRVLSEGNDPKIERINALCDAATA